MNGIESALFLEDDMILCPQFAEKFNTFLSHLPQFWNGVCLGGQHLTTPEKISDNVVRCLNTQRTHAWACRQNYMRALYYHWANAKQDCHLDWTVGEVQSKMRVYAPTQFLIGQDRDHSDISGSTTPIKFWNAPPPSLPVIVYEGPDIARLRAEGWHTGYNRNGDDVDVGLDQAMKASDKIGALRRWLCDLLWEVASGNGQVLCFYHPDISLELVKKVHQGPVYKIMGDYETAMAEFKRQTSS